MGGSCGWNYRGLLWELDTRGDFDTANWSIDRSCSFVALVRMAYHHYEICLGPHAKANWVVPDRNSRLPSSQYTEYSDSRRQGHRSYNNTASPTALYTSRRLDRPSQLVKFPHRIHKRVIRHGTLSKLPHEPTLLHQHSYFPR